MKINPGWRPLGNELKLGDASGPQQLQTRNFSDMMRQQDERASLQQLNLLLEQIQVQAERLSRSMTVRELRQYKLMLKRFLEETARRGVGLKETRGWDRRGRGKRYKIIEELDQKLLGLADELVETEQGRIELLQSIGEIRGMLINLFF